MKKSARIPSRRGAISVDYAPETWASHYATRCWADSGREYRDPEVASLARTLTTLHEHAYRVEDAHDAFIHMPDLDSEPLLVMFDAWQAEGDRDTQLRELTHADDETALLPPVVRPFATEALGTGLRTLYYVRRERVIIATVGYAFRSEEYETAVHMRASSPDLGRLKRVISDMDHLAHTTTVMPRDL